MKRLNKLTRRSILTLLVGLFLTILFGAQAARAQNIQPYVDCVERERDNSGALTGKYIAHFGYFNYATISTFIPRGLATNSMSPVRNPPNQPETFPTGLNPRAVSVTLDMGVSETWRLTSYSVTASFAEDTLCGGNNQNTRLMTYQGRLSDGTMSATGVYDLQFQLFNAATGGTARTNLIIAEDVTVANGIFTVPLNLGANASINSTGSNRALNAAILAGEDGFFEIGVRPGNSTGAFTTLTPRQSLTAVPFAMRADSASNAFRAAFADNAANLGGTPAVQFVKTDSSGNGTVSGNLNVSGTISSNCRSGFTPIGDGRLCISALQTAATFYGANGATQTCINMDARVGTVADATLSLGQSGFNYFSANVGWLGDYAGDNLRPTWNPSINGDFDGAPVNVYSGGSGGTAPIYPYRCVY